MNDGIENVNLRRMIIEVVDAQLMLGMFGTGQKEADELFERFNGALAATGRNGLLDAIQALGDVAWDLADSWASQTGNIEAVRENLRSGEVRGW